jgi:HEAT repeat protein
VSRKAPALCLAALGLLAAAPLRGAEPGDTRRLTDNEKRTIHTTLDACGETLLDRERLQANVAKVVELAAGREGVAEYLMSAEAQCLASSNLLVRMASIEVLGRIGNRSALPALNDIVEFDPCYSVRIRAAKTIAGFGSPPLIEHLYREIPDFDGSLRKSILASPHPERLQELGRTISRVLDRFPSLIARLDASDKPLREKAVGELQRLTGDTDRVDERKWKEWWKAKQAVPDLSEAQLLDPGLSLTNDRTFVMALIELAALTDAHEAVDGLGATLRQGSVPVRMAAAAALGRLGGAKAAGALRGALADPDGWVKTAAAEALAAADPQGSAGALARLLDDWAPQDASADHQAALARVRRSAVAGLKAAGAREAGPRLAAILLEPRGNRLLNWDVADALGQLGAVGALGALARYGASGSARERDGALAAVAEICRREPVPTAAGKRAIGSLAQPELLALAAGSAAAAGAAAVWELDRRGLICREDGRVLAELQAVKAPEPRLLTVLLVAHREWPPAVAELARMALAAPDDETLAPAACAAAAEAGAPEAASRYLRRGAGRPETLSASGIQDLRRRAGGSLAELLAGPGVPPGTAAAAAGALAAVVARDDAIPYARALEALMAALGDERLRAAHPEVCAALRRLTDEDFPDEAGYWLRWWKAYESGKGAGRGKSVTGR